MAAKKRVVRRRAPKRARRSGKKYTNIGLVPLGVGINALDRMGIIDGAALAINGNIEAGAAIITANAGNVTNWAASIIPAVIAGGARKLIGKVPLISIGSYKINMF